MASTVSTMSTLKIKELNIKEKVVAFGANDDTKKLSLKFPEPSAEGDFSYVLPAITANKNVLCQDSPLKAADLFMTGTSAIDAIADADSLLIHDASANAMKKCTAAAMKTYTNAGQDTLPSGSANGQMVFYDNDASAWVAAAPSGDIGADKTGAMTIQAGSVEQSMIANDAVGADQLASSSVVTDSIVDSAVTNAKLAGSIASSKLSDAPSGSGAAEASKFLQADASRDVSNVNNFTATMVKGTTVQITDAWRLNVSSTNLQVEYYDSGSWVTKGSFSSA